MNKAVMFSSASDEWETPQELFDSLDAEFHFTIDVAARAENTKCDTWLGPGGVFPDALAEGVHWGSRSVAWCNPPYSRGLQARFIAKAAMQWQCRTTTVMLLPARTDTIAFHSYIYDNVVNQAREGVQIRFLRGRLKFGGAKSGAPFPSMVVVFNGRGW